MQTYLETHQDLPALLEAATREGRVRIQRGDGKTFVLQPEDVSSPLDVPGVDLGISSPEIVAFVRESREHSDKNVEKMVNAAVILLSLGCFLMVFYWMCLYPQTLTARLLYSVMLGCSVVVGYLGAAQIVKAIERVRDNKAENE